MYFHVASRRTQIHAGEMVRIMLVLLLWRTAFKTYLQTTFNFLLTCFIQLGKNCIQIVLYEIKSEGLAAMIARQTTFTAPYLPADDRLRLVNICSECFTARAASRSICQCLHTARAADWLAPAPSRRPHLLCSDVCRRTLVSRVNNETTHRQGEPPVPTIILIAPWTTPSAECLQ